MISNRIKTFIVLFLFTVTGFAAAGEGDLDGKLASLHKRPTVGLVLSGGSARGFAHIGVLKYLEKLGIRPDYIAGTSMGSIVGSLYALGYSADEIEGIVACQDWDYIISNKVKYPNMAMSLKPDAGKYFVEFSLKNKSFELPAAIIGGQHITEMIDYYEAWQSFPETDFSRLPIPFFCVAVNLSNGKMKVFTEGYLPEAVRASMAIPSVFTPEVIDGIPYIDGGVKNNFPVDLMKEIYHPDIIIGSFTGFKAMKEFDSFPKILAQTVFLNTFDKLEENKDACDILIEPDVYGMDLFDFDKYRDFVALGEAAAERKHIDLSALASVLESCGPDKKIPEVSEPSPVSFDRIVIEGLNRLNMLFVREYLGLREGVPYSRDDVAASLSNLYGTGYFQSVDYRLRKEGGDTVLKIIVKEKSDTLLKVGIKYDSDYNAAMPFNLTSFNFLMPNTKLKLEGILSQNPSVKLTYDFMPLLNGGITDFLNPHLGVSFDFSDLNIDIYDPYTGYNEFTFRYSIADFNVFIQSEISNSVLAGAEAGINYSLIKEGDYSQYVFQPGVFFTVDTRDDPFFPRKGIFFSLKGRYLYNFNPEIEPGDGSSRYSMLGRIDWKSFHSLSRRITFEPGFSLGVSEGDNVPVSHYFYLGGVSSFPLFGNIPLSSLHRFDMMGADAFAAVFSVKYMVAKKHYVDLFVTTGTTEDTADGLLDPGRYPLGVGVKYSYKSILGPVEFSVVYSDFSNSFLYHLNIGFVR